MYRYNIDYMKSPVKRSNTSSRGAVDERMRKLKGLILGARDGHSLDSLFFDLLTPHERTSIGERVAILEAIARGQTLREVAKKVHVSMGKVERGSNVFQYGKVDWKKALTPLP
jgi:Trp operon repressor